MVLLSYHMPAGASSADQIIVGYVRTGSSGHDGPPLNLRVLGGLPIPEIYLRSSSSPTGETTYQVVDGQQRIRSILLFTSNDLELYGEYVNAK